MTHEESFLPRWPPMARLALFVVLFVSMASLSRGLTSSSEQSSPVWLPSGLLLFALLTTAHRHWPAVTLTFVTAGALHYSFCHPGLPGLAVLVPTCGALEGLAGAALLRRFIGPRVDLHRVRDVLGLVVVSAGLSPLLSAFLTVALMSWLGADTWPRSWHLWRVFWIGHATGVLVVTPLLLAWPHRVKAWEHRRRWEWVALLLVIGLATHAVFRSELSGPWFLHPLVYLAFPLICWAALRFEAAGAISGTALLSTIALWHTAHGAGPFAQPAPLYSPRPASQRTEPSSLPKPSHRALELQNSRNLFQLQSFLAAVSLCGLLLAAALGERRRAQLEVSALNLELHQSLERLARTQAELVSRERMATLGELSATLAHEVRNPLSTIANCVALLRSPPDRLPGSEELSALGIITEEVQRLDHLVRELLDLARPVQPQPRPQPLDGVVEEALSAALRSQVSSRQVTVRREVEPGLPPALVDVPLLHVALANLFTNALQAMPEGGALHVRIQREPQAAERLLLSISDTGRGMTPEVQRRIFEPFFTTRANGTGLGLPIVRRIVEGHLGEVEVRSAEGRGTTFTVRLPCLRPARD